MTAELPRPGLSPSGTSPPLVCCEGVARTYGSGAAAVVAVHGVTCAVTPGGRVAVVGPSGCGKSTLLHLMAGLDRPTVGTVSWPGLGADPSVEPRLVGVVFQGPSLLPPLDAVENVALPLHIDGLPEQEARARAVQALEQLGLAGLADRLPEELSAGQAQRVAVARVLARRPRLILADEPTGQLDHATANQVLDVLLATAGQIGAAVVMTTHDPAVARRLEVRWHLADGRLHLPQRAARCCGSG